MGLSRNASFDPLVATILGIRVQVYGWCMSQPEPIFRASTDDLMALVSERGSTPQQIGAVLLLDAGHGLEPAWAFDLLVQRITAVPQLRQRLVNPPFGCGRPVWVDDPSFKIANHVTTIPCPAPGGESVVLGIAAELIGRRLPRDRPLWAATLVTDTAPGEAALIQVFHRVLADGIGGLAVLAGLVDGAGENPVTRGREILMSFTPEVADSGFPRPGPSRTQLAVDAALGRIHSLRRLPAVLHRIGNAAPELYPAVRARAAPTSLNRPTGPRRTFVIVRTEVNMVHRVARLHGAPVNDVVLTSVASALQRLLEWRGEHVHEIVISVPFSDRRQDSRGNLGNHSGVIPLAIPAVGDPATRLNAVAGLTRAAKQKPPGASTAVLSPLFRLLARVGLYQRLITSQRLINTFASTMRGPEIGQALFGCPITGILPLSVPTGNITVSFVVLSYAGELAVTIAADPDACPDVAVLGEILAQEFLDLESLAV